MPRNRKRTTSKAAWTEEDLQRAKLVIEKGMSKRRAAATHQIPFTTLRDRLKNDNMSRPQLGRKPIFNREQESEIAEQIKLLGTLYYGLTVSNLRKHVYKYAELNNINNNFDKDSKTAGVDWVQGFIRRNPYVAVRKAEATGLNRVSAFNKEEITHFYSMLIDLMEKHKFTSNNIYNADETGITTVPPGKVLAEKGQRRVGSVTSGERGRNITVMCAMSAAGNFIPLMFIFPRKRMTPLLEKDGPRNALYTNSNNGWITETLFVDWLKHFAAHAKPMQDCSVLLIIDNHSSHISLQAYNFCKEKHIIMVSIPPHTSHRTQPLDVSFYGPLKAAYRHECNMHMKTHLMAKITPYDVASIFNKAYGQVANISKAEAGFRATGIYPLNPHVFTEQDFLAASLMTREEVATVDLQVAQSQGITVTEPLQSNALFPTPLQEIQSLAGSSKQSECLKPESPVPGPSNEIFFSKQRKTPVSFASVATTPTFVPSSKPVLRKRKQHATVLTATPMKSSLENKENKKVAKPNKNLKTKVKASKKMKVSYKRKVLQETSSESEDEEIQNLCDDNSNDDLDDYKKNYNKCITCKEFGRDNELWYRCTSCGLWSHALCSGWDCLVGYTCDICAKIMKDN